MEPELVHTILKLVWRLKIFVDLSNRCLEIYVWPMYQFIGGILLITLSYGQIRFFDRMPALAKAACFAVFVICVLLILGTLIAASNSATQYQKVLVCLKRLRLEKKLRKSVQSVPLIISLKVGDFHYIDKYRVLIFTRFIMQRTLFLVVNSKSDIA